ncbi:MAG: LamG-like jellyroll fold domain-containing protein [Verrucomicrobiales bacterium]
MNFSAKAFVLGVVASVSISGLTSAAVVTGHWRMETDNDPGTGFSIPNEIAGGSPLVGSAGAISALNGGGVSFYPTLTQGAVPNGFGLDGSPNINGSISSYLGLNPSSITLEFFGRTNEGDARFLIQQSGATGLRIDQPNNLRVQYSTASGQVTLTGFGVNYDADWDHFAFTYDEVTGVGSVFLNGLLVGSNDGPDGEALTWPAGPMLLGQAFDGGGPFSGTGNSDALIDELRIVDAAIQPYRFMIGTFPVPEPSRALLLALGMAGFALRRRR